MNSDDLRFEADERERYMGHLSLCEIDLAGQAALRRARVLIVGCGGLGSPVALYLAAAGVGHIGLVDSDAVSLSNLQRQIIHSTADLGRRKVESARDSIVAINPAVDVRIYPEMLTAANGAAIAGEYDIVADCTDSFRSRIAVNDLCVSLAKPMAFGSVSRFSGLLFTYLPGHADYGAIFGREEPEAAGADCSCAATGVLNAAVGVVGSLQAAEVIKLITGTGEPLVDRLLAIDLLTMDFTRFAIRE